MAKADYLLQLSLRLAPYYVIYNTCVRVEFAYHYLASAMYFSGIKKYP